MDGNAPQPNERKRFFVLRTPRKPASAPRETTRSISVAGAIKRGYEKTKQLLFNPDGDYSLGSAIEQSLAVPDTFKLVDEKDPVSLKPLKLEIPYQDNDETAICIVTARYIRGEAKYAEKDWIELYFGTSSPHRNSRFTRVLFFIGLFRPETKEVIKIKKYLPDSSGQPGTIEITRTHNRQLHAGLTASQTPGLTLDYTADNGREVRFSTPEVKVKGIAFSDDMIRWDANETEGIGIESLQLRLALDDRLPVIARFRVVVDHISGQEWKNKARTHQIPEKPYQHIDLLLI